MVSLGSFIPLLISALALLGTATSFWLVFRFRNLEAKLNTLASKIKNEREQHC